MNSNVFRLLRKSVVFILQILIKETDSLISYEVQKLSRVKGLYYFHSMTCIIREYNPDFITKTRSVL